MAYTVVDRVPTEDEKKQLLSMVSSSIKDEGFVGGIGDQISAEFFAGRGGDPEDVFSNDYVVVTVKVAVQLKDLDERMATFPK